MECLENECIALMQKVEETEDVQLKKSALKDYIRKVEDDGEWVTFPKDVHQTDLKWVNCKEALAISDLSGKLVLLDFFTYCCINCIHIMPFLHKIEADHPVSDGLVVIGVHSAKFPNEKMEVNIANAIQRYNIQHPVINDSELQLWEGLSVKCWPTMVLLSPDQKILFSIPGESHLPFVELFLETALEFYREKGKLTNSDLGVEIGFGSGNEKPLSEGLRFPGKIAIDDSGTRLAISDSGHHRILICGIDGTVTKVIGGSEPGCKDGEFVNATFHSPQGVTWHGPNTVFVADCDNHLIRKIDLMVHRVVTVAGTGQQGSDLEGGKPGLNQAISSPWDLLVGGSPRFPDNNSLLYIAMSGCHQIWALFLKDADYQKGVELKLGTCIRYAGNGNEENRNNSYPHKAGFAQPSGLAVDKEGHALYVADSESSTVRRVNLANGAVQALVGGAVDPTDLFAYGDVDGKAREARLQHPIGVAWDKKRKLLYVADTYNHKIKVVNPATKVCETIGISDEGSGLSLNEPSGICVDPLCDNLYIADTNNHDIKILSLANYVLRSFKLQFPVFLKNLSLDDDPPWKIAKPLVKGRSAKNVTMPGVTVALDGQIVLSITCSDFKLNKEAPSAWQVRFVACDQTKLEDQESYFLASGDFSPSNSAQSTVDVSRIVSICKAANKTLPKERFSLNLCIESVIYYCMEDTDVCKMQGHKAFLPVEVSPSEGLPVVDVSVGIR